MPSRVFQLASVLLLISVPLAAQQSPNKDNGFSPEKAFHVGEIDSINAFNGNLILTIPIGGTYPAGGGLEYGLTLVYNSNVWEQEIFSGSEVWNWTVPNRLFNAGLGWRLSLGQLVAWGHPSNRSKSQTWVYIAPDGSQHEFWNRLHPVSSEPVTPGVFYTRDGTYLRLNANARTVEFPNGQIHTFNGQGRLVSIRDRFNNYLTVNSLANPWVLRDSTGREHKIHFTQSRPYYHANADNPNHEGVVTRVDLAAFDDQRAHYDFVYQNQSVFRGCPNTHPGLDAQVEVPLLTGVILPDGSRYAISPSDYNAGSGSLCDDDSGVLRKLTLPTLGKLEWDYGPYVFPSPNGENCRDYWYNTVGVSKRRLVAANDSVVGEWTYGQELENHLTRCAPMNQEPIRWSKGTVTTPSGHRTEHYFSVVAEGVSPDGWREEEYGLPFTRCDPAGSSCTPSGPPFLSTRTYNASGGLERSTYVTYEFDTRSGATGVWDPKQLNQRLARARTTYGAAENRFAQTSSSNFDGFGHYRATTLSGNFGSGDHRIETVNYNPGVSGAWPVSSPWILNTYRDRTVSEGGAFARTEACFEPETGFLLRTRTLRDGLVQGDHDLVAVYQRDSQGNVTSERYHGGDLQSLDDGSLCSLGLPAPAYRIDHTYQHGSLGTSRYFEASGAPMSFKSVDLRIDDDTALVATAFDTAGLKTDFEYDALGRLTLIKPQPGHDGRTQYVYNRATSSASPAWVRINRLPNGSGAIALAQDEVHFDTFGRLVEERRRMPDGTWASRSRGYYAEGWLKFQTEWNGLATRYQNMDPFGRPGKIKPPDGSGPHPGANPAHDIKLTYFGDRQVVRRVRVGTSRDPVSGAIEETEVVTSELYDRQGRLWKVFEPSGADGADARTVYGYDVGGRLASVATKSGGLTQSRLFNYDNRGFLLSERHPEKGPSGNGYVLYCGYDARGHATRSIDGNSGTNCNQPTPGALDVSFTFDRAERLTAVHETGAGGRLLKEFVFATAGSANGKLRTAERHNYVNLGGQLFTDLVRETYTYGGRGGRVSERLTENLIGEDPAGVYRQGWAYDDLGNVESLTYPNSTCAFCPDYEPRTVTFGYTNGYLTSVAGFTGTVAGQGAGVGLTYHPNGLVHQVAHANGVTWTQVNDPYGMQRPTGYSTTGARNAGGFPANWRTDGYSYDGAGNVIRIGPSWFLYDGVSRLTEAMVFPGIRGGGTPHRQTYAHGINDEDPSAAFGNIQAITTQIGTGAAMTLNIPTSWSTNRLSGMVAYDNAGNLRSWNGQTYSYDAIGRTWKVSTGGGQAWVHLYTADDERLWSYQTAGGHTNRWTLRDLDGKVLREYGYDRPSNTWTVERDYVYRGTTLLAAVTPAGVRHFHPDHLGSPRLVTDGGGIMVAFHTYLPFGEEATAPTQDDERMKFTGHERDLHATSGANPDADDLDYMHARYYNPQLGRFLSVDPMRSGVEDTRSWNRYAYGNNNPLRFVDPDGRDAWDLLSGAGLVVLSAASAPVAITVGLGVVALGELGVREVSGQRPGALLVQFDDLEGEMAEHALKLQGRIGERLTEARDEKFGLLWRKYRASKRIQQDPDLSQEQRKRDADYNAKYWDRWIQGVQERIESLEKEYDRQKDVVRKNRKKKKKDEDEDHPERR